MKHSYVSSRCGFLLYLMHYSPVAQLVECLTVNQNVVGSSPTWGARLSYS